MWTEKLFAKLTDAQQILQTLPSPFIGLTVYQTAKSRALLWGAQPSGS